MSEFPGDFLKRGKDKQKENKKFMLSLQKMNPRKLDTLFHDTHDAVFEKTDCLKCANCCKTTSPIFKDRDIDRLSKRLRMRPSDFVTKYLYLDNEGDYVLHQSPCAFLLDDNTCEVYPDRPAACREYPHTDRKNVYQLMPLTAKNTLVCPAVEQIVDKIRILLQSSTS
ncbi:MAG: YkgJ family cysteine cluster protein [Cryomorphaceae bacterium]|nr:YkgJ family cysteine cluster protein [Cryomorphaceae bacterium]